MIKRILHQLGFVCNSGMICIGTYRLWRFKCVIFILWLTYIVYICCYMFGILKALIHIYANFNDLSRCHHKLCLERQSPPRWPYFMCRSYRNLPRYVSNMYMLMSDCVHQNIPSVSFVSRRSVLGPQSDGCHVVHLRFLPFNGGPCV